MPPPSPPEIEMVALSFGCCRFVSAGAQPSSAPQPHLNVLCWLCGWCPGVFFTQMHAPAVPPALNYYAGPVFRVPLPCCCTRTPPSMHPTPPYIVMLVRCSVFWCHLAQMHLGWVANGVLVVCVYLCRGAAIELHHVLHIDVSVLASCQRAGR